jgi:hypothetical protein
MKRNNSPDVFVDAQKAQLITAARADAVARLDALTTRLISLH